MSFANGPFTTEMPLTLAFGLAFDEQQIEENNKELTEYEKEKLIVKNADIKSKEEMENLRREIEDGDTIS